MIHKSTWKIFLSVSLSFILALGMLNVANAADTYQEAAVDLAIDLNAPQHVKAGSTFEININYSNPGTLASPDDTWVTFTLPDQTTFVAAVDSKGVELPPAVEGNTLTWVVGSVPAGFCCRHIYVTLVVDTTAAKGDALVSTGEIGSSAIETYIDNNTNTVNSTVCDMRGTPRRGKPTSQAPAAGSRYGR